MIDQFLYQFQKQPPPEFSKRLYHKIISVQSQRQMGFRMVAYGLTGMLIVLGMLFAGSPAVRIYAQEIIYTIGQWVINHQPTAAEQFENKLESGKTGTYDSSGSEAVQWQAPGWLTLEEAEALAGFKVFQLQLDDFDVVPVYRYVQSGTDENVATCVNTVYGLQEGNLVIRQTEASDGNHLVELPVGAAEVRQVELAEGTAYWIVDLRLSTYVNDENKVEPKFANVLIWENDEFEFWLQTSPGLALEEMLLLAQKIY